MTKLRTLYRLTLKQNKKAANANEQINKQKSDQTIKATWKQGILCKTGTDNFLASEI